MPIRLRSLLNCFTFRNLAAVIFLTDPREKLADKGVEFELSYTGEVFGIVTGGLRRGAVYDGLLEGTINLDFAKLIGWHGLSAHFHAFYPHGAGGTERFAGDLGTFSNIDFYDSYRLFEAWLQHDFLEGRLSIRAGLLAIDEEFGVGGSDYSSLFINSDFGADIALSANMPAPIYAIAAPGLRIKIAPRKNFYLMGAVYDGNPAPGILGDPSPAAGASTEFNHFGTHWALRAEEGLLLALELGWSSHAGKTAEADQKSAPGETSHFTSAKIGLIHHTDEFGSIRDSVYAGSTLEPRRVRSHHGNHGIYALFDRELWREPGRNDQGLGLFLRGMWAPRDRNYIDHAFETGLVYKGAIPGRDNDRAGLGIAYAHVSRDARDAVRQLNKAEKSAIAAPDYEAVVELSYAAEVTSWMVVQPDIQFIVHPGGSDERRNAVVAGVRLILSF